MKFFARYSLIVATCMCLAAVSTCRNRGNDGDNGNGNDNNGGGDEVPADVQKAVDDVVAAIESASQAVAGSVEAFGSVDLNSEEDNFGDCPEVIFVREDNVSTFGLTFEAGCESEYYENNSVSGSISVVFDRNAGAFDADFDAFTVDGQATTGDLHVSRIEGADVRTWSGSIDLTTTGVGSVVGDIVLVVNVATSTITIDSASLSLTNADDESHSVEVDGLVIRPVANGNFVPQAGTVTFEVPNSEADGPDTITVIIEFDASSPDDGTVKVTFGEGTVENYPLGGL